MFFCRLQQSGIIDFLIEGYMRPGDLLRYYAPRELELVPLNLDHLAGAFIVLVGATYLFIQQRSLQNSKFSH